MISKFSSIFFLACLVLFASFSGCKTKSETDADHPLIVAYTSGVISILSPVRVALTGAPVADDVSINLLFASTLAWSL